MQLTKHTDYAFRILIFLASREQKGLTTIQEIAERYQISRNHLMKIVQKLSHAGFVNSIRGNQGGIHLGKAPAEIGLREVIELMEQTLAPVNCHEPLCILTQHCQLRGILFQAQEKYLSTVGHYSLADLIQPLP